MRLSSTALVAALALAVTAPLDLRSAIGAEPVGGATTGSRPAPTISVSGTTELAVAPDEAWIHLRVESFFPTMRASVGDNDTRIAAVLKALAAAGIGPADLATEAMSLAETDRFEDAGRKTHGWQISRAVTARVRDLATLERTLQDIIAAGATHIDRVVFSHSKLADKKADARDAAMRAARDKAERMAGALGQHVGKAVVIREGGVGGSSPTYANAILNEGGTPLSGATIAAGRIRVDVSVDVDFELL